MINQTTSCSAQTFILTLGNHIDGLSLISLINDFDEFRFVVPVSSYRLKLKKIVEQATHMTSDLHLVDLNKSTLDISDSIDDAALPGMELLY